MFWAVAADNDGELLETELSRESGTPVADLKQIDNSVLSPTVSAGQIMRLEYFRAAAVVSQGDQVRLVAVG